MSNNIEKQIYFGSKDELEQLDKSKEIYFSDCFNFGKTYSYPRDYEVNFSNLYHVHYGDIHTKFPNTITKDIILPYIKNDKQHYVTLLPGDIVVADASEDHKDLGKSVLFEDTERTVIAGLHTHFLRNNNNIIDSKYYLYFTKTDKYIKEMRRLGTGISVLGISKTNLNKIKIPYESLENQLKIAATLSQIDNLIDSVNIQLIYTQTSKEKIIQCGFCNDNKDNRSIGFDLNNITPKRKLGYYISLNTEKNTELNYGKHHVLSVTKHHGLQNQIEYLGRSYAGKDISKYKIIKHHELCYTKSPLKSSPFGIIKVNQYSNGIISTLYSVFKASNKCNPYYVDYYFSNDLRLDRYLKPLITKGAKNTMNISDLDVLNGIVMFPDIVEQNKIANFLSQMDKLIEIEEKKLEQLEKMKKYHLQQFFN